MPNTTLGVGQAAAGVVGAVVTASNPHRNVVWLAEGGAHRRSSSRGQEWNTIFLSTSRSMKGRNQSPGDQFVGNRLDMIPATLRRGASRSRRGLAYLTTPVLELRPASCCEPCSACATGLRSGAPLTRTLRSRPLTCSHPQARIRYARETRRQLRADRRRGHVAALPWSTVVERGFGGRRISLIGAAVALAPSN